MAGMPQYLLDLAVIRVRYTNDDPQRHATTSDCTYWHQLSYRSDHQTRSFTKAVLCHAYQGSSLLRGSFETSATDYHIPGYGREARPSNQERAMPLGHESRNMSLHTPYNACCSRSKRATAQPAKSRNKLEVFR